MMRRIMFFFAAVVLALAICLVFSWIDVHGEPVCPDTPMPTLPPPDTATPMQPPDTATPTETVIPPTDTVIPPPPTATPTLPQGTPMEFYPPGLPPHGTPGGGLIPPAVVTPSAGPTDTPEWNKETPVVLPTTGYEPKDNNWFLYIVGGGLVVFGLLLIAVSKMRGDRND